MIARLRGRIVTTDPACVVEVGGVGFELQVPEKDRLALPEAGAEVEFHTYLHVREDQLTLFGFVERRDRELFTRLLGVSGVGPRTALRILGEHAGERIVRAVVDGDHGFLCKLPGLGRKTAERLTMELRDKLKGLEGEAGSAVPSTSAAIREEAITALSTLGMSRPAAEKALEQIDWSSKDAASLASVVKQALKHASGA